MGRIERGGGDGGEPARSPPGRPRFRRPRDRACGCDFAGVPRVGADRHACLVYRSFTPKRVLPQQTPVITQDFD